VYWWADGVYFNVRLEDARTCVLVLVGATEDGTKELLAIADGFRESKDSWADLLRELKAHGLAPGAQTGHCRRFARLLVGAARRVRPRR
jgi:putative transposase